MTPHQNVIVLGASRGLGLAIAREYLERGASVVGTVRGQNATELHDIRHTKLRIETVDFTDDTQLRRLRERLSTQFFDLLFVVAGIINDFSETAATVSRDTFSMVMNTNALSPIRAVENLAGLVVHDGTIAIMSSQQASITENTDGTLDIYRASKTALNQLARSYAARNGGCRSVVLTAPGWVGTDLGGASADLTVEQSVPRLVDVVDGFHQMQGIRFVNYDGRGLPW